MHYIHYILLEILEATIFAILAGLLVLIPWLILAGLIYGISFLIDKWREIREDDE